MWRWRRMSSLLRCREAWRLSKSSSERMWRSKLRLSAKRIWKSHFSWFFSHSANQPVGVRTVSRNTQHTVDITAAIVSEHTAVSVWYQ